MRLPCRLGYSVLQTSTLPFFHASTLPLSLVQWGPDEQLRPQPYRRYATQRSRGSVARSVLGVLQVTRQTSAPHQHIRRRQQWRTPCCNQSRNRAAQRVGRHFFAAGLHRRQRAEREQAAFHAQARQQLKLSGRAGHPRRPRTVAVIHCGQAGRCALQPSAARNPGQVSSHAQRAGRQ